MWDDDDNGRFFFFFGFPSLLTRWQWQILGEEGGLLLSSFLGGITVTVRGRGYCREKIEPS
jgi:hypothetical protein